MTSLHTSSRLECMALCYKTDGCLAVNVIGNTCQLTRGLSNEDELLMDSTSMLFVLGGVYYLFTVDIKSSLRILRHCSHSLLILAKPKMSVGASTSEFNYCMLE